MGTVLSMMDRLVVVRDENQRIAEEMALSALIWSEQKAAKDKARSAERKAAIAKRTPSWADKKAIERIYMEASKLTRETGIRHDVDHIIPLRGKLVSGLHVENNLRAIPWNENRAKSNEYTPAV